VQLVEAYFDESGSHGGSPVLAVAGYIIEKDACIKLDEDWGGVLDEFRLPYFRMSECAHGTGAFKTLSLDDRIDVEKRCIAIIRRSISYGIAVTVEPRVFDSVMPKSREIGSAYTYCAYTCLAAVKSWSMEQNYTGGIAYFFESGHRSQAEANDLMNRLFSNPQLKVEHRYTSHTFADKIKVRALQAADLIAYQWYKDHLRRMMRPFSQPRKDCFELMHAHKFYALHHDERLLRRVAAKFYRGVFPRTYVSGL
jgi:Protein of unknown function (DUF3800)